MRNRLIWAFFARQLASTFATDIGCLRFRSVVFIYVQSCLEFSSEYVERACFFDEATVDYVK